MRKISFKCFIISKIITPLVVVAVFVGIICAHNLIKKINIKNNTPDPATGLSKKQLDWHNKKQERVDLLLSDIEYVRDVHGIVYVCLWNFDTASPNGKYPVTITALSPEDAKKIPERSIWTQKKSP